MGTEMNSDLEEVVSVCVHMIVLFRDWIMGKEEQLHVCTDTNSKYKFVYVVGLHVFLFAGALVGVCVQSVMFVSSAH